MGFLKNKFSLIGRIRKCLLELAINTLSNFSVSNRGCSKITVSTIFQGFLKIRGGAFYKDQAFVRLKQRLRIWDAEVTIVGL